MRKLNLIYLGALAQKRFDMKNNFTIIEYASDEAEKVQVPIMGSLSTFVGGAIPTEIDTIVFEKVGNHENREYAWIGYSRKANVLAIKIPIHK